MELIAQETGVPFQGGGEITSRPRAAKAQRAWKQAGGLENRLGESSQNSFMVSQMALRQALGAVSVRSISRLFSLQGRGSCPARLIR